MQEADALIRTKLHRPFTRAKLVPRPRLQARVAVGLRGPLTLIIAPAGYGKTTLVASCVALCDLPIAWLSLDREDNQAGRFLRYLVAALQEADPALGSEASQLAAASPHAPYQVVLTSLINDLDAAANDIVLVLDDYHFISNEGVHDAIAFLLEHSPGTLHLVVATRSDPPLALARLRARGQIVELRGADLGFTPEEAAQFLNEMMGLNLDGASISILEERTEGWIAGLQMAALSLRERGDVGAFLRAFAGTHRFIMDFMMEEVLAREPQDVQTFLIETSLLQQLTGPLCDAVTGTSGGQYMLEELERRNLFVVPLDDERRWYRYHHLFADLLRARLDHAGPDRAAPLLSRAAAWCAREGHLSEAIGYALAARDFERAGALIAETWHLAVNRGEVETVMAWLRALPEDTVRASAPLSTAYCWVLWFTGLMDMIEPHLVDAEKALAALTEGQADAARQADAALPALVATLRSIVARYKNDFDTAVVYAERARLLIPDDIRPQEAAGLSALHTLALASAHDGAGDLKASINAYAESIRWSRLGANAAGLGLTIRQVGGLQLLGHLREADAACRDGLAYIAAQGMARLPAAGILHVALSEVLVEQNNLDAAEDHLSQGAELGRWSGRLDAAKNAAYALSRLRLARDDVSGALAAVTAAESAWQAPLSPLAEAELLALKARVLIRQGALGEAAQCVEEARHLVGPDGGQTAERVALAAARVLLAESEPSKAVSHLTQALADSEARGCMGVALELRILRSLVLARCGRLPEAHIDLERALALAEPEGYVRVFLDEGPAVQQLLAQWLAHADPGPLRSYALHLLAQFGAEPQPAVPTSAGTAMQTRVAPPGALIDPLSSRELEVLHLIALGHTNQQIARQLFVAPGTVKAHTSNIYRKLDVANRTEAVTRARELGLLP